MEITEPATLLTDYLMAALAAVWFRNLRRGRVLPVVRDWRGAFLFLALSSFLGGTYHGFQSGLAPPVLDLLWRGTLVAAALASLFLLLAGTGQFSATGRMAWRRFAWLKAAVVLLAGQAWPVFLVVLADSAASLLVVGFLAIRGWQRGWGEHAMFLAGIGLFLVGGTVQAARLAPHPAFNHNDLFHVIQILGNGMFYLCAREALRNGLRTHGEETAGHA